MLLISNEDNVSVHDVMKQIVSIEKSSEKASRHYFEVKMLGVTCNNGLMDEDVVRDYLIQHSPLPFDKEFKWKK